MTKTKNFSKPTKAVGDQKTGKTFNKNIKKSKNDGGSAVAGNKKAISQTKKKLVDESLQFIEDRVGNAPKGKAKAQNGNAKKQSGFGIIAPPKKVQEEEPDSDEEMTSEEEQDSVDASVEEPEMSDDESDMSDDVDQDADDVDDEEESDDQEETVVEEKKKPVAKKTEKKAKAKAKKPAKKEYTEEERKHFVTVFVGNLPLNLPRKSIHKVFGTFGSIVSIRFRSNTGEKLIGVPKGNIAVQYKTGLIVFSNGDEAKRSLAMNGQKIKDNIVRVNLAGKEHTNHDPKRTIFVGNLKYRVTDDILHETFRTCGELDYVRSLQCKFGCKGTAYVCFKEPAAVVLALKLNKTSLFDREMRVERYSTGKQTERKKSDNGPAGQGENTKNKRPFMGVKNDKKNKPKNKAPKGQKLLAKKIAPKAS